jgi:glutamate-ammonia-ligase adenylyltransferase
MGASPQLGEILIHTPEYFHWLVSQVERSAPDRQDHEEELVSACAAIDDPVEGLNLLRRWKRRETLRIGTRDLLRHETVQTAAAQLSDVAAVAIDFALAIVMQRRLDADGRNTAPGAFAVIGTGHLGSHEMTYSSTINVLYVYDTQDDDAAAREFFVGVGRDLTAALSDDTHDGTLYDVELPPWPQTDGSLRACSLAEYSEHYASADDMSERLALTRARPIAGDAKLGARFMTSCESFVYRDERPRVRSGPEAFDIDALTQACQLAYGARHAGLRHTGTLGALDAMARAGLIPEDICRELDHAYVFLRSAEHRRQLGLEDAQTTQQVEASLARVREISASIGRLVDW